MAHGPVTVPCPECGASSEVSDPGLSRWGCASCGWAYFVRRCSACGQAGYVGALQGWHQEWTCVWCAASNSGFSQNRDPAAATIAELAADVARQQLSHGPVKPAKPAPPLSAAEPAYARAEPADSPTIPIPILLPAETVMTDGRPPGTARQRRPLGILAPALAAVAVIIVAAVLVIAARPVPAGLERASAASVPDMAGGTRAVSVTAGHATTVDFQGVPGRLTIVAADASQVRLTGQLHWTGRPPVMVTRLDRSSHVLVLFYRCAAASQCTENYLLTVPPDTAIALRQPPGQVTLAGLAGPLRITANGVNVSATGLRSSTLLATITAGHLSATFAAPPSRVTVILVSAQATLGLPRGATYRISQQVTSGYVRADIPQDSTAARTVTVRVRSGELTLLPS